MFFEDNFEPWPGLDESFTHSPLTQTTLATLEELNPPLDDEYYNFSTNDVIDDPTPLPQVLMSTISTQRKSSPTESHSLCSIFTEIDCLCDRLKLSTRIANEAQRLATRHALNAGAHSTRNQRVSPFTAAYVFAACRQENVPRSFTEISKASGVTIPQLSRRLHQIASKPVLGSHLKRARAVDYLPRLCAEAGFPFKYEREARNLLQSRGACETSQIAQAAGALLLVCGGDAIATIATVAGLCQRTVRKHSSALNLQISRPITH